MDKSLLLSVILVSKDEVAMMRLFFTASDFYLDIEVENVAEEVKRSYYSVSLYVADNKVVESRKFKLRLSLVKWEWEANNQMCVVL